MGYIQEEKLGKMRPQESRKETQIKYLSNERPLENSQLGQMRLISGVRYKITLMA